MRFWRVSMIQSQSSTVDVGGRSITTAELSTNSFPPHTKRCYYIIYHKYRFYCSKIDRKQNLIKLFTTLPESCPLDPRARQRKMKTTILFNIFLLSSSKSWDSLSELILYTYLQALKLSYQSSYGGDHVKYI